MKKYFDKSGVIVLLILLFFVAGIFYNSEMAPRTDVVEAEQTDPVVLREALRAYGYPALVIDVMDPAVKEMIYENGVMFHGASLQYYRKDGTKLLDILLQGNKDAEEAQDQPQDQPWELPDYDVCIALIGGLCYIDGKLDHIMGSMNYRWNHISADRKADPCQITWQAGNARLRDDGYIRSLSQTRKDGRQEWLQCEQGAAGLWPAGYRWYANWNQVNRWSVQNVVGAGLVQLEPMEGIDSIVIQGSYSYKIENSVFFEHLDTEGEKTIEFLTELELNWPKEKEDTQ